MANLLVVQDPERERRCAFLAAARADLLLTPSLTVTEVTAGDVALLAALHPSAPRDACCIDDALAFTLGDGRSATRALERLRRGAPWDDDGYGATVAWDAAGGLRVGADLLGLFPLVWWTDGEVVLAATTPAPFPRHARFVPALDSEGLVGILLTNGLLGGRSAWRGVRRLAPAHALVRPPRGPAREVVQWEPRALGGSSSFDAEVDRVHELGRRAVRRHVPRTQPLALALSGGLDSRQVGGLVVAEGLRPHAVTAGRAGDIELDCARRVARRLRLPLTVVPDRAEETAADVECQIAFDHGASGHALAWAWALARGLGGVGTRSLTGVCWDAMIGGNPVSWGGGAAAFEARRFLDRFLAWGIPAPRLARLLRPEVFGDALPCVLARLEATWLASGEDDRQRAHAFYRAHRLRFQAGSLPCVEAFHVWPAMPLDDREAIETAASLRPDHVERRRLQSEVVRRHLPHLARLPLDRNAWETIPLAPSWWDRLLAGHRRRRLRRGVERRRYYRVFDPDDVAWRAVRRAVEPHRRAAGDLFVPAALDELLPPPDTPVASSGDRILATNGLKVLLGTILWWVGPSRLG